MKNYKFKIGEWVSAEQIIEFRRNKGNRELVKIKKSICGQIVGGCYRKEGQIEWDEGYQYFVQTKTHFLYQVRLGFANKPILVHEDDLAP